MPDKKSPSRPKARRGRSRSNAPVALKLAPGVEGKVSDPRHLISDKDRVDTNPDLLTDAYNKVAKLAKLRHILLTASTFNMEPAFIATRLAGATSKFEFRYNSTVENAVYKADTGLASCEYLWSVTVRDGDKKDALNISTRYYVLYDGIEACDTEAVSLYLQRVAMFATYPYFRSHVSQVSWESGANLPILPTIST